MMLSMHIILFSVVPLALANLDANSVKILQMHNEYRQQILECKVKGQPAAKRMPPLIWDEELADRAKAYAKPCNINSKYFISRRFHSIVMSYGIYSTVEQVVERWFAQHIWYKFKQNFCKTYCERYLQMVFENTTHIGCGVSKCLTRQDNKYSLFVVFAYGPGATFDVRPYEAKNINEVCPVERTTAAVQPE